MCEFDRFRNEAYERDASSNSPWDRPRLHRQQTLALQLLAGELAGAADCFRPFADFSLRRLFVMAAKLYLAEQPFALHLLLQNLEGLVDIVVADEYLHAAFLFGRAVDGPVTRALGPLARGLRKIRWSMAAAATARANLGRGRHFADADI